MPTPFSNVPRGTLNFLFKDRLMCYLIIPQVRPDYIDIN